MLFTHPKEEPESYSDYCDKLFSKKLEKAQQLKDSIADLSLLPDDKIRLTDEIVKLLQTA